jgi:threonine dehydrogenase-like Zn-dependent dehydrogenase
LSEAYAHVLTRFGEALHDRRYPLPDPGPGEVLLRLEVSGVCGSDVHQWQGLDPRVPLPLIPGHEGVGRVVATGGEARDVQGAKLAEGDRIAFNRGVSCMACRTCVVLRQPALCPHRWVYGITRSCQDPPHLVGCYSSHVLLARNVQTLCLDDDLSPVVAVTAGCSGATAAHCFEEVRPGFGSRVVIQGPGPIGAYCAAFAKASGAETIIVVGGTASRLRLCEELGATHTINRRETTVAERLEEILELTGGEGADAVYEAAGDQAAIAEGLKWLRTGGAYVSCGVAEPRGGLEIDFFHDIARRNVRLQGIWVSDMRHLLEAVRLVEGQPETFERLVDGRFRFEEANEALEAVAAREVSKAVLIHDGPSRGAH